MTKVAVLGCGPAGLLAAHAAQLSGCEITIFAPEDKKSHITGAQYLHSAVPGITTPTPDGHLEYKHDGTKEVYAQKIYGDPNAPTSWDTYPDRTPVPAWSLRNAYDTLWRCYRHALQLHTVDQDNLHLLADEYDIVISTAPRMLIQPGQAHYEHVWIKEYSSVDPIVPPQTIMYSGFMEAYWYRCSNIFGHVSFEWPNYSDMWRPSGAKFIPKPVGFTAEREVPRNVKLLGRYGQWKKGVLVDHAFKQALEILEGV